MNAKSVPAGKKEKVSADFMVLTVSELDLLVFEALVKQGAAKKDPKQKYMFLLRSLCVIQSCPLPLNQIAVFHAIYEDQEKKGPHRFEIEYEGAEMSFIFY